MTESDSRESLTRIQVIEEIFDEGSQFIIDMMMDTDLRDRIKLINRHIDPIYVDAVVLSTQVVLRKVFNLLHGVADPERVREIEEKK